MESVHGYILHRLKGHEGLEKSSTTEGTELGMVPEAGISGHECGWTPDGRFVYSGESQSGPHFLRLTLLPSQDLPMERSTFGIFQTTLWLKMHHQETSPH